MKLSGKKGTEQSKKKSVGKAKKASEVIKVPGYELEIWEDAGVLEIGMSDGASVDIETAQIHPKDELTASFAAEHQVKTVFLVTFKPETYEEAKKVMRRIMDKTGGFFCGDTEDFTPMFV